MTHLATVLTTGLLLLYFYLRDNNREPWQRLIEAFGLGVALSLQVSFLQRALPDMCIFLTAFVAAAVIEEGVKLIVLKLTLFRSPDFTQKIDAVTYAVFLGLGFATVENITHVSMWEIGLVRAFTATPAHALFGVSMGFWLGMYKFRHKPWMLVIAMVVPTLLHGAYNYLIMVDALWGLMIFVPYVILLWIKAVVKTDKLRRKVNVYDQVDQE